MFLSRREDIGNDMILQFALPTLVSNYVPIPTTEVDLAMGDDQSEENPQAVSGCTIPNDTRQG